MDRFPKCCKPFPEWKCSKQNLQKVNDAFKHYLPQSIERKGNLYICRSYYLKISCKRRKIETEPSPVPEPPASPATPETDASDFISISSDSQKRHLKDATVLEQINQIMPVIVKSPIYPSKLETRGKYQHQKIIDFASFLPSSSASLASEIKPLEQLMTDQMKAALYDEFMEQLKHKFTQLNTGHEKIQLLTCLPKSLTIQQIQTSSAPYNIWSE